MLLGPTDLLEFNEDMRISICFVSGSDEKGDFKLVFINNCRQIVVENI